MQGAVTLRNAPGVFELVEGALLEADRERAQGLGALLGCQRGEECRVHAAGKENADRNVADEMGAHRVAHPRTQFLDELCLFVVSQLLDGNRCGTCEPLQPDAPVLPQQKMSRRQLAHLTEDRQRRRDRVEGEERFERIEVDLAARQRSEL